MKFGFVGARQNRIKFFVLIVIRPQKAQNHLKIRKILGQILFTRKNQNKFHSQQFDEKVTVNRSSLDNGQLQYIGVNELNHRSHNVPFHYNEMHIHPFLLSNLHMRNKTFYLFFFFSFFSFSCPVEEWIMDGFFLLCLLAHQS